LKAQEKTFSNSRSETVIRDRITDDQAEGEDEHHKLFVSTLSPIVNRPVPGGRRIAEMGGQERFEARSPKIRSGWGKQNRRGRTAGRFGKGDKKILGGSRERIAEPG
jgi:hypothetical protein